MTSLLEPMRTSFFVTLACLTLATTRGTAAEGTVPLTSDEEAAGWSLLWDGESTDGWISPKSGKFPRKMPGIEYETCGPKYRFEFGVEDVKSNVRMARGKQDSDVVFEPLTVDVPVNFVGGGTSNKGGATQGILENSNVVRRVVEMDTGNQVWPIP